MSTLEIKYFGKAIFLTAVLRGDEANRPTSMMKPGRKYVLQITLSSSPNNRLPQSEARRQDTVRNKGGTRRHPHWQL